MAGVELVVWVKELGLEEAEELLECVSTFAVVEGSCDFSEVDNVEDSSCLVEEGEDEEDCSCCVVDSCEVWDDCCC